MPCGTKRTAESRRWSEEEESKPRRDVPNGGRGRARIEGRQQQSVQDLMVESVVRVSTDRTRIAKEDERDSNRTD